MIFWEKFFNRTAYAMGEALTFDVVGKEDREFVAVASKFVTDVFSKMQPIYKVGLLVSVVYFELACLLFYRRAFGNLSIQQKLKLIERWQESRISLKRDFISFFVTLSIVAIYDSAKILEQEGIDQKAYLKLQCFYNSGRCL